MLDFPKKNYGKIIALNNDCAIIGGLNGAVMGEKIICPKTGSKGMVTGINAADVYVLFFNNTKELRLNLMV